MPRIDIQSHLQMMKGLLMVLQQSCQVVVSQDVIRPKSKMDNIRGVNFLDMELTFYRRLRYVLGNAEGSAIFYNKRNSKTKSFSVHLLSSSFPLANSKFNSFILQRGKEIDSTLKP